MVGVFMQFPTQEASRRRKVARVSLRLEPRSAYLLRGAARREWEHSIPPVESLRYSVTFRNLRSRAGTDASFA